jgi:hypothetical protein
LRLPRLRVAHRSDKTAPWNVSLTFPGAALSDR